MNMKHGTERRMKSAPKKYFDPRIQTLHSGESKVKRFRGSQSYRRQFYRQLRFNASGENPRKYFQLVVSCAAQQKIWLDISVQFRLQELP
jgi:hypothetical protein